MFLQEHYSLVAIRYSRALWTCAFLTRHELMGMEVFLQEHFASRVISLSMFLQEHWEPVLHTNSLTFTALRH